MAADYNGIGKIQYILAQNQIIILSALSLVLGFALIWYIWWLAAASFAALIGYAIFHTFNYRRDYYIPAETVQATEDARTQALAAAAATRG